MQARLQVVPNLNYEGSFKFFASQLRLWQLDGA